MRELTTTEIQHVCGGAPTTSSGDSNSSAYGSNDSLSATVDRNAGIGAIGGALGGGIGAIAGAAVGAMVGFANYYG